MSKICKDIFNFQDLKEFDDHKFVTFIQDKKTGLEGFIAIHRSNDKYPSFGATRLWTYEDNIEGLKDALRLSKLMSYKSVLAGIKYGGAKGVIIETSKNKKQRDTILKAYAREVNQLNGSFITGTDVGITRGDIISMKKISPYFVGFRVDPSIYTSLGVYYSLQACLKKKFGSEEVEGRTFAIQGVGKIGSSLLDLLYKDAKKIYISDINKVLIEKIKKKYPNVYVVSPKTVHKKKVDVFSPCALSSSINQKTVSELNTKIIVGGANNQLENGYTGEELLKRGIIYAPDYLVNAGGLISVVDEYEYSRKNNDRIIRKVKKIKGRIKQILDESEKKNIPTNIIADNMAKRLIKKYE